MDDSHDDRIRAVTRLWHEELQRAERAATLARQHEQLTSWSEPVRETWARLARRYHDVAERHRSCARIYERHLQELRRARNAGPTVLGPSLLTAVAGELKADAATLTLFDEHGIEVLAVVSGPHGRALHDLELDLGTGPARTMRTDPQPILADSPGDITGRWHRYGPAATALGVRTIAAVPVTPAPAAAAALCTFGRHDPATTDTTIITAAHAANALACAVLTEGTDDECGYRPLYDNAEDISELHQAMGITAAQQQCDLRTALHLLRARAFSTGYPLKTIAHQTMIQAPDRA